MAQEYALGYDIPSMLPCSVRSILMKQEQGHGRAYPRDLILDRARCLDAITPIVVVSGIHDSVKRGFLSPCLYLYTLCFNKVPGPRDGIGRRLQPRSGMKLGLRRRAFRDRGLVVVP